jgi:large repetitive protein
VKLSAGNEHSAAINKNQELFSWGSKYQTGLNDKENRHTPLKLEFFKNNKVSQVSCGGLHTLAVTKDNKVFCWGSTEGGQLGLPLSLIQKLCRTEDNSVMFP